MTPASGCTAAETSTDRYAKRYQLLDDRVVRWADLPDFAVSEDVRGRRIHDARLVAVMRAYGLSQVLSFGPQMDAFTGVARGAPTE